MKTTKIKKMLVIMMTAATLLSATVSLRASDTDDRIESSAKKTYVFKTYLANDMINTKSNNGMVTLTGTVSESSHKTLAEDTVASLPGVKSVDNQLVVKEASSPEYSDAWLAVKVKSALLFHRNVSAIGTEVSVKDGIVSLRGQAASAAQKDLTEEYASDVDGIKEVRNNMTIENNPPNSSKPIGDKIDDASVTAQVKWALLSRRSTSAIKTSVETNNGVVTISGEAKNKAEVSLVTKLVSDIEGVNKVVNNMTIAGTPSGK